MEEATKQRDLPTSIDSPVEKQLKVTLSPIYRLSPRQNRSTLLDSFELQAVTRQLNKAIMQGAAGSSPACMNFMDSPFYRQRLSQIFKENARTSRKLVCSQEEPSTALDRKVGIRAATRGFVGRLWKRLKQGLTRNKQTG